MLVRLKTFAERDNMCTFLRCFLALLVAGHVASAGERREYIAAVYEHAVVSATSLCANRSDALKVMQHNLDAFDVAAQAARKQGADIIVFPEYGITGLFSYARTPNVELFFEAVPDPLSEQWCPCASTVVVGSEVQHYLSCLARNNSIYVVANMGDMQPCQPQSKNCRPRGYYLFNTNVVFAPDGCLVARYHKEHLFLSEALILDVPPTTEHVVFETDFGRFGLFICFDVVFRAPAIDLVEQYGIDSVAFPTAWMNVFPYYSAIAYHSGWARGMNVNFLAANLHLPNNRMVGSGIYSPSGPLNYAYNTSAQSGVLLVTTVPVVERRHDMENPSKILSWRNNPEHKKANDVGRTYSEFSANVFGDIYTFVVLEGRSGITSVCQKDVCCSVNYTRSDISEDKVALGAFDGTHTLEGTYYMQVCLVVKCLNNSDDTSCGSPTGSSAAIFSSFTLISTTSTSYVFPQVLTTDNGLAPREWQFSKSTVRCGNTTCWNSTIQGSFDKSLISSTIVGRHYDRDTWPYDSYHLRHSPSNNTLLYPDGSASIHYASSSFKILVVFVCIITLFVLVHA